MSSKWSDTGILRKRIVRDNFDDLLVFGYACKLFRDDERALYVDQGKHLIPWMANEGLKIDRYDGRGALSDLTSYEASREGYDATRWLGLADSDRKIEQLCDKERYYSLYNNEDEEKMYREEESKRQASKDFQYQYDQEGANVEAAQEVVATCEEEDKPFVPPKKLNVPIDIDLPKTKKENARIEKTAMFVAQQGPQMEILIKAKQTDNPQFSFLNQCDPLHKYYRLLLTAIKAGQYGEMKEKPIENGHADGEKDVDVEPAGSEHYLHPSLANMAKSSRAVSPPKTPTTLPYRPTADCAYSQLVSRIQGNAGTEVQADTSNDPYYLHYQSQYYIYYQQIAQQYATQGNCDINSIFQNLQLQVKIQQQAVQYAQAACVLYATSQAPVPASAPKAAEAEDVDKKGGGILSLVHYSSDSEEVEEADEEEGKEDASVVVPPSEEALIIEKMATYVAKNGPHFEQSVRDKGDPRFDFLNKIHMHFNFYQKRVQQLQCQNRESRIVSKKCNGKVNGPLTAMADKKSPVSFSIKKPKDDAPKEIRSALLAEESDEEKVTRYVSKPSLMDSPIPDSNSVPATETNTANSEPAEVPVEAPRTNGKAVLDDDFLFEMIDLTEEKCGDQRLERRVRMSLAMRERALQLERRKRATLFLQMRTDSASLRGSRTKSASADSPCLLRTEDLTQSDSELEEGEIRQRAASLERKRKKAKKSSHRRRSKSRRSRSVSKARQRKHKKRKYSPSSSSSSEHH